jgi:hypothetical protein
MFEKVFAALLLFIAFAVTVILLGLQWLGNQSAPAPAAPAEHSLAAEVAAR